MRVIAVLAAAAALVAVLAWAATGPQAAALFHWASMQQRAVQEAMAGSLRAIRGGDPLALAGLCALCFAYGFLHAVGPGHGKVILGGTALAGGVPLRRMLAIGTAASLGQSVTAILLMTAGAGLVAMAGGSAELADGLLAAFSRWAIAAIGAVIAWRGARQLWRTWRAAAAERHDHAHDHHDHHGECGCGHVHAPSAEEVAALRSPREVAALILGVAIRPCTGALFLLAIAFRFGIPSAGILGVLAMGIGTAAFNAMAIAGGSFLSRLSAAAARPGLGPAPGLAGAGLQIAAGSLVILLTLGAAL
ncbi:nickel/cobalt transporter [Poseidonocella sp. HB161398]|uniref:nickel/cobalt transporter n=1 Tax=Poseidonocella sp. HB161398 TaxID=2320855 RepID=UPI001108F7A5|nr:hypothetical protein [Poseidonocella sp. HB161398]